MVYYSLFLKYAQCSVSEISINNSFLDHAHLGVFQEQEFLAVGVEGDFGLEVGGGAGDLKDLAWAEAVVFDPLAGLEVGHRSRDKVGVGDLRRERTVAQGLDPGGCRAGRRGLLALVPDTAGRTVGIASAHTESVDWAAIASGVPA